MKSAWGDRLRWLVLGGALVFGVYWFRTADDRANLVRAMRSGEVQVEMQAVSGTSAGFGLPGSSEPDASAAPYADLKISLPVGAAKESRFVLPAGTVIGGRVGGTQRLMTAAPLTVQLSPGDPSVERRVETYCLDPFKPPPQIGADLVFEGGNDEESEAGKLAMCLKDDGSRGDRQLAIWLIAHGYMNKPYGDARNEIRKHVRVELGDEVTRHINTGLEPFLRKQFPNATEAMIQRQLARFTPDKLSGRLDREAEKVTESFLAGFLRSRFLLGKCGYNADKLPFFTTAGGA